jgi:hypothetical protein
MALFWILIFGKIENEEVNHICAVPGVSRVLACSNVEV